MYQECQIYHFSFLICHYSCFACVQIRHNPLSGGYCGGVPPLPIPNREVKPTCADGTAMQCGRVGRRLLSMKSLRFRKISEAFLFFFPRIFFFSAGVIFYSGGSFTSDLFFIGIFLHRISRMNRKAILLIGLLTDFRGYLAAGQWLAPEMSSYFFVTQISQMTQIFLIDYFSPTDFTDLHRFFLIDYFSHGFTRIFSGFLFFCHFFFFLLFLYFVDFRPVGLG